MQRNPTPADQFDETDEHHASHELARVFVEEADRLRASIRARIRPPLIGRIDVDDVLQESYLAALARIRHRRDADRDELAGWIRYIVEQTLVDLQRFHLVTGSRSALRERAVGHDDGEAFDRLCAGAIDDAASPVDGIARSERVDVVIRAIALLSPGERCIVIARCVRGMTNAQVGQLLGLAPESVAVRLSRAKTRLRRMLAG